MRARCPWDWHHCSSVLCLLLLPLNQWWHLWDIVLHYKTQSSKHVPVSLPVCRVPRLMTGVPNAPTSLTPQLLLPIIQPAWATSWMNWSNGTCFTARKLGWCSMPFFLITRTISLLPTKKQSTINYLSSTFKIKVQAHKEYSSQPFTEFPVLNRFLLFLSLHCKSFSSAHMPKFDTRIHCKSVFVVLS